MAEYFNSGTKFVKKGDVVFEPDQRRKEMKTRFITSGRGTGKTTELIREAVESPRYSVIVASCEHHANYIKSMLNKMYGNSNIVPVVKLWDILTCSSSGKLDDLFIRNKKLYIDDLIACLFNLYPLNSCDIAAAVINTDGEYGTYTYLDTIKECIYRNNLLNHPHIDHVIFNGPATIVFWNDGTKTVVKHDGKGRKDKRTAIMYAFMRKIYGEGKEYHNILGEIEEVLK